MDNSRKGRLIIDGDTATLIFKRTLAHAPELVWQAIITPEGLREWLICTSAKIDGPLPDWMGRFQELVGEYPAWTQHATSTDE
jgi:uncharacterized protein YndB with AHSA1/START domain